MRISTQCPKCGGNMCTETDMYGSRTACLQCGYARDLGKEKKEKDVSKKSDINSLPRHHSYLHLLN